MELEQINRWKEIAGDRVETSRAVLLRFLDTCEGGAQLAEFAVLLAEATFGCAILCEMMKKENDRNGAKIASARMLLYRDMIALVEAKLPPMPEG